MTDLGEFLRANLSRRRVPGVWDCCAFPADWALANGRDDPMREWRGAYSTDAEAKGIIERAGGLDRLFTRGMDAAGITETGTICAGDIGVLQMVGEQAGAVYTGKRWALVAERGLAFGLIDPECVVKAWPVQHG